MPEDPLEPIPATRDAFRFLASGEQQGVEAQVRELGARVRDVVPETVGVSLSFVEPEVTFTLAVSDRGLALDGVQHLQDEPCVAAVRDDEPQRVSEVDVLDEERWSAGARASAHDGVRSSLSVPVHVGGVVVGGLTVYAGSESAFEGHGEQLAALVQAPAAEAIRDADLSFATRRAAEGTLRTLEDQVVVDMAAGILAAREEITAEEAVHRLQRAAAQAGVPVLQLAELVLELRGEE